MSSLKNVRPLGYKEDDNRKSRNSDYCLMVFAKTMRDKFNEKFFNNYTAIKNSE